jgi:photoactive yellow protein
MPATTITLRFDQPDLARVIDTLTLEEFDLLDFGVIGFDDATLVCLYNATESAMAGLSRRRVIGQPLFASVAQCMDNYLVAQRFEDAQAAGDVLDATIDYVLTLRMAPVAVKLRLIAAPGLSRRYVLIDRAACNGNAAAPVPAA